MVVAVMIEAVKADLTMTQFTNSAMSPPATLNTTIPSLEIDVVVPTSDVGSVEITGTPFLAQSPTVLLPR